MKYPTENLCYSNCYLWYSNHYTIKPLRIPSKLHPEDLNAYKISGRLRPPFSFISYILRILAMARLDLLPLHGAINQSGVQFLMSQELLHLFDRHTSGQ